MQGKVTSETSANPIVHVGIDVCKVRLDVHIMIEGSEGEADVALPFANDKKGTTDLIRTLSKYRVAGVMMEPTGKFHRAAHRRLDDVGYSVKVMNPQRSRKFADCMGLLAKTDKVDARALAMFSRAALHEKTKPLPQASENLSDIVNARDAAVAQRTALINQYKAATLALIKTQIKKMIRSVNETVKAFDEAALAIIKADPALMRRLKILTSVPGIGRITAVTLIANMPELGHVNSKQIAMLAGLAPIAHDSGDMKGRRQIKGGRAHVRSGIYMATMSAVTWNTDIKKFYDRLVAVGKVKMVALTASMRKLLVLTNSLLKEDRLWFSEFPIAKPLSS